MANITVEPCVSIIVPVYNTVGYLENCLNSLKNQTYKNLEIILVDDGSTDNSGKICDEYALQDCRFKVFHQQNHGAASARNFGITKATGYFLHFIDSDDFVENNLYEICVKTLLKTKADWITWKEHFRFRPYLKYGLIIGNDYTEAICNIFVGKSMGPSSCMQIYKREIFIKNNITFPNFLTNYEDMAIVFQYALKCSNIFYLEKGNFYHRTIRTNSITRSYNENIVTDIVNEITYFQRLLKNSNIHYQSNMRCWIAWELFRCYPNELKSPLYKTFSEKISSIKNFYGNPKIKQELNLFSFGDLSYRQSLVLLLTKYHFYMLAYFTMTILLKNFSLLLKPFRKKYLIIKEKLIRLWQ